jgi:acid stress-induced BolA-like protein IbaG/YrbA
MQPDQIKQLIEAGLACEHVSVTGDGRHFEAVVVSDAFEGKRSLARHRMVYATLGDRFDTDELHALALKTLTASEWQDRRA